jgi:hypothetical protein
MQKRIFQVLFLFFILNHCVGLAQNDCRQDLGKYIEYYNAGMYEKTIELLENKIKKCHFRGVKKLRLLNI